MGEATREAREQVASARRALGAEVDELGSATRSALDIPAKVRRNPVKSVGLAGGAVFLVAGGPKRVLKGLEGRLRGKPPKVHGLLPKEIERAVDGLGADAPAVRARLEREFAAWLEDRKKDPSREPGARRSFWSAFEAMAKPLSGAAAKRLVQQFLAAEDDRSRARAQSSPSGERVFRADHRR